jgi:hypothetical protein
MISLYYWYDNQKKGGVKKRSGKLILNILDSLPFAIQNKVKQFLIISSLEPMFWNFYLKNKRRNRSFS